MNNKEKTSHYNGRNELSAHFSFSSPPSSFLCRPVIEFVHPPDEETPHSVRRGFVRAYGFSAPRSLSLLLPLLFFPCKTPVVPSLALFAQSGGIKGINAGEEEEGEEKATSTAQEKRKVALGVVPQRACFGSYGQGAQKSPIHCLPTRKLKRVLFIVPPLMKAP